LHRIESHVVHHDTLPKIKQHDVEFWPEDKVEKWFEEKHLKDLFDIIKPLDGRTLFQLYQFQIYSPEFFYKSITKNEKIDFKILAAFGANLKELFN
jgi:hypothetical protein